MGPGSMIVGEAETPLPPPEAPLDQLALEESSSSSSSNSGWSDIIPDSHYEEEAKSESEYE